MIVYELSLTKDYFYNSKVEKNLKSFKISSDMIIANRSNIELSDVMNKVLLGIYLGQTSDMNSGFYKKVALVTGSAGFVGFHISKTFT